MKSLRQIDPEAIRAAMAEGLRQYSEAPFVQSEMRPFGGDDWTGRFEILRPRHSARSSSGNPENVLALRVQLRQTRLNERIEKPIHSRFPSHCCHRSPYCVSHKTLRFGRDNPDVQWGDANTVQLAGK